MSIACVGAQWCFYGLFAFSYTGNHGFLVVVYANCVGALMGCYYTYSFQENCLADRVVEKGGSVR